MQKATVGRVSTADWSDGMLNRSGTLYLDNKIKLSTYSSIIFWGNFTFHFIISTVSNAFLGINNRDMKKESGFSLAMHG